MFPNRKNVPRLWNGTVFVLGGGPSLKEMDLSSIHDQPVIGVNDAFKLGHWVDVIWFGDSRWYNWNKYYLNYHPGIVFGCPPTSKIFPKVIQVDRKEGFGLTSVRHQVVWNKSSGASAINLALHLGAKRVVLLGFDMKVVDGQHNWHNNHKHFPNTNIYEKRFLPPFEKIASDAKGLKLEILNATPGSALTLFPMVNLADVISCQ